MPLKPRPMWVTVDEFGLVRNWYYRRKDATIDCDWRAGWNQVVKYVPVLPKKREAEKPK